MLLGTVISDYLDIVFILDQKLDTLEVLLELTEEDIKTLLPLLGDRLKFKKGLDDLKRKIYSVRIISFASSIL